MTPAHGKVGAAVLAMTACASAALAQATAAPPPSATAPRPDVSVVLAVSRPADAVFREAYGSATVPLSGQVDWPVGRRGLVLFGGVRHARASGSAVAEPVTAGAEQPLRFRMTSARVGAGWRLHAEGWTVTAAGGPSVNWYREEWEGLGLAVKGRAVGLTVQLSGARPISRRLAVVARGEFTTANASPRQDPALPEADLGGFDLGGGFVFRF